MNALLVSILSPLLWMTLLCVPLLLVFWRVMAAKAAYKAEAEEPFTDLPLRLPGESTRKRAEEHFEKLTDWLLILGGASVVAGSAVAMGPAAGRPSRAVVLGVLVAVLAIVARPRIMKALRGYWNCQLGFKGERAVAEELNQLLSQGWRVFHDVPFDGYNVDHVAVGPVGGLCDRDENAEETEGSRHGASSAHREMGWPAAHMAVGKQERRRTGAGKKERGGDN